MSTTPSRADWVVIGVPSSAGAHHAGQDRAPAALRDAGLIERMRAAGLSVTELTLSGGNPSNGKGGAIDNNGTGMLMHVVLANNPRDTHRAARIQP